MSTDNSNPVFDYVARSALSLTMAGSTGISPFLTLFLLGLTEAWRPDLLNMADLIETILSSGWCLVVLGLLTAAEIFSKCIPALDELVDSAEVFIVPILSIVASLATLGVGPSSTESDDIATSAINNILLEDNDSARNLQDDDGGNGFLTATTVVLVVIGIVVSLSIHFLKMIIRVSSLVCTAGFCQPCITVLEVFVVCFGVPLAILSTTLAIIACILILVGVGYVIVVKCRRKNESGGENGEIVVAALPAATATTTVNNNSNDGNGNGNNSESKDVENPVEAKVIPVEATAIIVDDPSPEEGVGVETIASPVHTSKAPAGKPDVEAKIY